MAITTIGKWVGGVGDDLAIRTIVAGNRIYAGLWTSPAIVVQINPATMLGIARWTGAAGENRIWSLGYDGTFIYAVISGGGGPGANIVVQLNPVTMLEVNRWTAGGLDWPTSVCCAGGFVYIGGYDGGALGWSTVIKVNPATMLEVNRWFQAPPNNNSTNGIVYNGTSLYIVSPGDVVWQPGGMVAQLNPTTMLEINRWSGVPGNWPNELTYDGVYVYVGLLLAPGVVAQLNPITLLEVNRWTGAAGEDFPAIGNDGTYIYAALATAPGIAIRLDRTTMVEVDRWIGAPGEDLPSSVAFDGTYIYFGLGTSPGIVIQAQIPLIAPLIGNAQVLTLPATGVT